jgi:rare lipoprotein A
MVSRSPVPSHLQITPTFAQISPHFRRSHFGPIVGDVPHRQKQHGAEGVTVARILRTSAIVSAVALSLGSLSGAATAQEGGASWYGSGRKTANGERFNPHGLTAAHRSLPFGTRVEVTDKRTGRSVVVRINDRGPFIRSRVIDLSRGFARALGMGGTTYVSLRVVG